MEDECLLPAKKHRWRTEGNGDISEQSSESQREIKTHRGAVQINEPTSSFQIMANEVGGSITI